jgi:hypothetical protein
MKVLIETASIAVSTEGTSPQWPVVTAVLIAVYRSEKAKREAVDNYAPPSKKDKGQK